MLYLEDTYNIFAPLFAINPRIVVIRIENGKYSLRAYRDHISEVFISVENKYDSASSDEDTEQHLEETENITISTDRVERLRNFIKYNCNNGKNTTIQLLGSNFSISCGSKKATFNDIKEPLSYQQPPDEPYKNCKTIIQKSSDMYSAVKCCSEEPQSRRYLWTDYPPNENEYIRLLHDENNIIYKSMDKMVYIPVAYRHQVFKDDEKKPDEECPVPREMAFRATDIAKILQLWNDSNCKVYIKLITDQPLKLYVKNKHTHKCITTLYVAPLDYDS